MTRMLALVRSPEDATAAIDGGIDGLVLRSPTKDVAMRIARHVAGRCPLSLWWDVPTFSQELSEILAACGATELWGLGESLPGLQCWAVVPPGDDAGIAASDGAHGVVVAGADEPNRLLSTASITALAWQRRLAEAGDLRFGISGSMEAPDVPRLLALKPDLLLMDDLLRQDGSFRNPIVSERVRHVGDLIVSAQSDLGASMPVTVPLGPDRIFVRDWTVVLHLGAYGHETAPQRVRFTVEAEVARKVERAADMRDVVTYDLVTDAIARATITHVALVETIAEDIAAMILAHPRVSGVDVTVEKLDLGPGALGCRILRRRAP